MAGLGSSGRRATELPPSRSAPLPLNARVRRIALIPANTGQSRHRAGLAILAAATFLACDRRPIDANAALPAPGTPVPSFAFPAHGGTDSVRSAALTGAPTVLALWSTHCPYQDPWVASFSTLAQDYGARGVRVVVLADDEPGPTLDSALARAPWRSGVSHVAVAGGALSGLFDRSRTAPERSAARVEFVLPSFLLVGPDGRVLQRAWGSVDSFRPALDSLLERPARSPRVPPA